MLNDLRRLFRKSLEAFRAEVGVREPQDPVAELLSAMRRELVMAKAELPRYEEFLVRSKAELVKEKIALAECERRLTMAEKIRDEETVRIAGEFAARHRERILVLEQKATAAEAELGMRRREAEEMGMRYKEADANRFVLISRLRMSSTRTERETILESDDQFADFSRMEEKLERNSSYVDALGELEEIDSDSAAGPDTMATSVDERLEELKRRMGK
jgi:hypothetical protein